jgi:hypothetical protein
VVAPSVCVLLFAVTLKRPPRSLRWRRNQARCRGRVAESIGVDHERITVTDDVVVGVIAVVLTVVA